MKLINTIGNKLGRTGLKLRKASPTIMIVVGVGSVIGGTVLACRATLKAKDVMEGHKEVVETIEKNPFQDMDNNDRKKSIAKQAIKTTGELAKLYALPVALEGVGIACIFGSHGIMSKRNAGLTAAYAASTEALRAYRKKVAEKIGENDEEKLYFGVEEVEGTDLETGKKKKTQIVTDEEIDKRDPYFRWFNQSCAPQWTGNTTYDLFFLQRQESYWNDILHTRGHVFLNEVYDSLCIPHSSEGAIVGWVKNGDGDNYISFGLKGEDGYILGAGKHAGEFPLDFNVDGVIYDLI